ncbi:HAD family hydrolase [Sinorhizobium sp. 8-89]|uniref:HAD family hydrolase n=1 Tax=Sinorhizobium sp. 7-81 TaxID=3049087 RepID=UPI0024C2BD6A|nr:HAD family hydrolase [Sinorhizobium sp. 7-81]MDK1386514.1 HAD family hydrolase [Sinorhizobium sp. 7-81]
MFPARLLVTDVDRTILTHGYELPASVVGAFRALRDSGVRIVLATARSPEAVRPYAERLELSDLVICFNGGWVGDVVSSAARRSTSIERTSALKVVEFALERGLATLWYANGNAYTVGRNPVAEREVEITGETIAIVDTVADLPAEPGKIMCVRTDPSDECFDALKDAFSGNLMVAGSHWRLLEVGPLDVSKRTAIEALAGELGIGAEDCVAAGDAENDLGMLRWAGTAVTVANAIDEIKAFAEFVGPSCDEGGMADVADWLRTRRDAEANAVSQGGK